MKIGSEEGWYRGNPLAPLGRGFFHNYHLKRLKEKEMTELHLDKWQEIYAQRVHSIRPSAVRILFAAAARPDIISLAGGMPHASSFPLQEILEATRKVIEKEGEIAFQYGSSEGNIELRKFIANFMKDDGIKVYPEDIIITDGAQQALDLVAKIMINPGDPVITEAPSYVGALNAFLSYQSKIIGIPLDDDGLQTEHLPRTLERLKKDGLKPKFIYTIPNFQNPGGVSLSLERRKFLVSWAKENKILLIEDNAYGPLSFKEKPLPTLKSMNSDVIYLGTFSKIFSPGVRIGWLTAPRPILEKMIPGKEAVNLCPSPFTQKVLVTYLKSNDIKKHIQHLVSLYKKRKNAMLDALNKFFPEEASWTKPQGGFFVWATLPSYINTTEMLAKALEEKVAYVPGEAFFADGRGLNSMRLNFSFPDPEAIYEGIKRLAKVVKEQFTIYRAFFKVPATFQNTKSSKGNKKIEKN